MNNEGKSFEEIKTELVKCPIRRLVQYWGTGRGGGGVDFGHLHQRLKRELAHDFCKYDTPLDNIKFI